MAYAKILVAAADGVATITLNDPTTMNAAGIDTVTELADAFRRVAGGEFDARAVVLTGAGRGFCSGANLSGGGPAARSQDGGGGAGRGCGGAIGA